MTNNICMILLIACKRDDSNYFIFFDKPCKRFFTYVSMAGLYFNHRSIDRYFIRFIFDILKPLFRRIEEMEEEWMSTTSRIQVTCNIEDVPLTNLELENRMFCSQEGILPISQRAR